MRRTILVPVALAASALLFQCGLAALGFDVSRDIPEQQLAAGGPQTPLTVLVQPFSLVVDVDDEAAMRGAAPATAVTLTSLTLRATGGSGTFDFLDSATMVLEAPGLPPLEIAVLDPVPRGQTELVFAVVTGADLLPYLEAGATLRGTAQGTRPTSPFSFAGTVVLEVQS